MSEVEEKVDKSTKRQEWFTVKCLCGHESTLLAFMSRFGIDTTDRSNLLLYCSGCSGSQIFGETDIANYKLEVKNNG
ncbi:MAG: hypothetical protein KAT46_03840 [Deltaproteobacteria bacterium]|nr:hypothetical protein [Deltaproteobacteria bacterium]